MPFNEFKQLEDVFSSKGVEQIFVKFLARKQDNGKNQIYFGQGKGKVGMENLFPSQIKLKSPSESIKKPKSSLGKPKTEALLDFYWLDQDGNEYNAPSARIIYYFQYPEARFSGFMQNCINPPDCLRRENQAKYGKRILILGSDKFGKTYGLVLTELNDLLVGRLPDLPISEVIDSFRTHIIGQAIGVNPTDLLLKELQDICGKWHPSITLKKQGILPQPFKGNQGGGYTLEALLGIPRNASKNPDKHGFEIKSFKNKGKISLMTPTADLGEEGKLSFMKFMQIYGWPAKKKKDGRIVFNGLHKYKVINSNTDCFLDIDGFSSSKERQYNVDQIVVGLFGRSDRKLISGWSYQKLLDNWSKKHASACYVEYEKRSYTGTDNLHDAEYLFTGNIYLGLGTEMLNYLEAISSTVVYYDPGHEISAFGKTKVRPQWRVSVTKNFLSDLECLYRKVHRVSLS